MQAIEFAAAALRGILRQRVVGLGVALAARRLARHRLRWAQTPVVQAPLSRQRRRAAERRMKP